MYGITLVQCSPNFGWGHKSLEDNLLNGMQLPCEISGARQERNPTIYESRKLGWHIYGIKFICCILRHEKMNKKLIALLHGYYVKPGQDPWTHDFHGETFDILKLELLNAMDFSTNSGIAKHHQCRRTAFLLVLIQLQSLLLTSVHKKTD